VTKVLSKQVVKWSSAFVIKILKNHIPFYIVSNNKKSADLALMLRRGYVDVGITPKS